MQSILFVYLILLWKFLKSFSEPIALHQLISLESGGDIVIRLKGYDSEGETLTYKITSLPKSGYLYQLSQVFSTKGYNPKAGVQITQTGVVVSGSNNRVYYARPSVDYADINEWGSFNFTVSNGKQMSREGTVTLVPPAGSIVGSEFLLSNENWMITGNKASLGEPIFEAYSRGLLLNRYIYATDDKIYRTTSSSKSPDQSLWYFSAPSDYLGNIGISYGGYLQFTLAAFSGDFSSINGMDTHAVELECASCVGPVGKGITLAFPISAMTPFTGTATTFKIPLIEGKGWLKDPQNSLLGWTAASQCDVIQVLSRLSSLRILGDWTTWYETVALDNVKITNTIGKLPLCAMQRPDASICSC